MWYRFHGYAGPGHQSSWETYVWLEGNYDTDLLAELAEDHVPDWAAGDGSNITKAPEMINLITRVINQLPPEERARQVEKFQQQLRFARHMLSILVAD